jgi:hypothetical protein
MGHALRTAYSILDDIIARKGEDGFLVEIEHEVICGRKLLEIAQAEGLLYSVLWNWLKDVPERLERYRTALKGYGDALISETVGIAVEGSAHRLGSEPGDVSAQRGAGSLGARRTVRQRHPYPAVLCDLHGGH